MKFSGLTFILIATIVIWFCSCSSVRTIRKICSIGQCPLVPTSLYVDKCLFVKAWEINVFEYAAYLAYNNYDSTLFPSHDSLSILPYKELLEDLRINKEENKFMKFYRDNNFNQGGFAGAKAKKPYKNTVREWGSMPMGGISQEQAQRYCKWIEMQYRQFMAVHNQPCIYEIRLPSSEELFRALRANGIKPNSNVPWKTYRFVYTVSKN